MANTTTLDVGVVTPINKGVYSPTTTYERLNIVSFNGSSYMAKGPVINVEPTNTQY